MMEEPVTDSTDPKQALGALLRKLRGRLTQAALSNRLNNSGRLTNDPTSDSSISRIENGQQIPTQALLEEILTATEASPQLARRARELLRQSTTAQPPKQDTPPPAADAEHTGELSHRSDTTKSSHAKTSPDMPAAPASTRSPRQWSKVAVVVLLVAAVGVWLLTGPLAATTPQTITAPTTTTNPSMPTLSDTVTGTPNSTAVSNDGAAYAEFYRDQSRFILIDLRADGRSAVLLAKINGDPAATLVQQPRQDRPPQRRRHHDSTQDHPSVGIRQERDSRVQGMRGRRRHPGHRRNLRPLGHRHARHMTAGVKACNNRPQRRMRP
jgi:transcriptional regulator with XRE-family HTH domain